MSSTGGDAASRAGNRGRFERRAAAVGAGRSRATGDESDFLLEHKRAIAAAVERAEQDRGADRRVSGERQFARRGENSHVRPRRPIGGRTDEHGFGKIEFSRDRQHRRRVSPSVPSTTASGFPVKAWSVKTSSVVNRRFIRRCYRGFGRLAGHCLHTRDAARSGGVETCRRADSQINQAISADFKTVCNSASPVSVSIARNSTSAAIAPCARLNATRSFRPGCPRRSAAAGAGPDHDPAMPRRACSPA